MSLMRLIKHLMWKSSIVEVEKTVSEIEKSNSDVRPTDIKKDY